MTRRRRGLRTAAAAPVTTLVAIAGVMALAVPAAADHQSDEGYLTSGYATEAQAMSTPCPAEEAGSWSKAGPVVCFPKLADDWTVAWVSPPSPGCSYYPNTGWSGTCVYAVDRGDHVKVWATSGVTYERFRLTWRHGSGDSDEVGDTGHDDGSGDAGGGSGGDWSGLEGPAGPEGYDEWDPGFDSGSSGSGGPGSPARAGSPGEVSGAAATRDAPDAPASGAAGTGDTGSGDGAGAATEPADSEGGGETAAAATAGTDANDGASTGPIVLGAALTLAASGGGAALWHRRRARGSV